MKETTFPIKSETTKIRYFASNAATRGTSTLAYSTTSIFSMPQFEDISLELEPQISFGIAGVRTPLTEIATQDKNWRELEQFLAEWDASGLAYELNDQILDDMRRDSDNRLDDLYGLTNWE